LNCSISRVRNLTMKMTNIISKVDVGPRGMRWIDQVSYGLIAGPRLGTTMQSQQSAKIITRNGDLYNWRRIPAPLPQKTPG
jgi:hypothetical protein